MITDSPSKCNARFGRCYLFVTNYLFCWFVSEKALKDLQIAPMSIMYILLSFILKASLIGNSFVRNCRIDHFFWHLKVLQIHSCEVQLEDGMRELEQTVRQQHICVFFQSS